MDIEKINGKYLFDQKLIESIATSEKPFYVIGVDAYDKEVFAYCLFRKKENGIEVLVSKRMKDEEEFRKDVETLAKIFEADVYKTK